MSQGADRSTLDAADSATILAFPNRFGLQIAQSEEL
jgi:hypothetical protein